MSEQAKSREDLTGRSRFGRNVAFAWGGYAVNIVAGFIMPRLISDRLGQTTLGVWDFCWSIVTYFGLVQLNIGSSINRYVARHRAAGDHAALCRSVSTIHLSLQFSAAAAALLAMAAALWIVPSFGTRLGSDLITAQWVVLILGLEIAATLLFSVYYGTLTGCHRWDLHNLVSTGTYAVMTGGMIATLIAGGGLVAVAAVHCVVTVSGEVIRMLQVRRVCPELKISFRLASWPVWLEQARFSVKSLVPRFADMIANQSLSFLVTGFLGPAALAIYSRPQNLVRQGSTLAAKFGFILVPTASSMQAQADEGSLRRTFHDSIRQIGFLGMPMAATLAVVGDEVIRLWMGSAYVCSGLMTLMAIVAMPAWLQEPVWSIFAGLNQHGRLAWIKFISACLSGLALAVAFYGLQVGLLGAAVAFLTPGFLADAFVVPFVACRRIGFPLRGFYRDAILKPAICVLPYALCLLGARFLGRHHPGVALAIGIAAPVILCWTYWVRVLPNSVRRGIQLKLGMASV